ncbi:MAG TPA: hypothetical protein VGB15_05870 [Longimicrobium sp.]|jgi:hypothetical protein
MATNLDEAETVDRWPDEAHSPAALEYLRAHGVRPASRKWTPRPGFPVKQRPMWLAFIFRTLRKLRLYDD